MYVNIKSLSSLFFLNSSLVILTTKYIIKIMDIVTIVTKEDSIKNDRGRSNVIVDPIEIIDEIIPNIDAAKFTGFSIFIFTICVLMTQI